MTAINGTAINGTAIKGTIMERAIAQRAWDLAANYMTADDAARGIPGIREAYERLLAGLGEGCDAEVTPVVADGVPCLIVRDLQSHARIRTIHFHGGGYVVGSARGSVEYAARLSAATDAAVLVVDYRLSPEHPYPAAIDDAKAAYDWLCRQNEGQILVSGESAGGGLAVALGMVCRDKGAAKAPAGFVMLSPFSDLAVGGDTVDTAGERDPFANREKLMMLAGLYLAGADARTPLASPLFGDLHGLAPMLIACSAIEALRSDADRLHAAAQAAGVASRLVHYPDTLHIFGIFPFLPEAAAFMQLVREFASTQLT